MAEEKKIFEMYMKTTKIIHTETEKDNEKTEEVKVTLEGGTVILILKTPGNSLKQFVDGEHIQVTITQPQTTLDVEVIGEI